MQSQHYQLVKSFSHKAFFEIQMELHTSKKLKLLIGVLSLLVASSCNAQFREHGFRLLLPNAGLYSGNHPELIDWMKANGVPTSNFKFGGDLFCVTYQTRSNV